MILVIDNYDSFTFNLVQQLGALGAKARVARNDRFTVDELLDLKPERIVVSPGPCTPAEAGVSVELVRGVGPDIPVLGVCLGHQVIAEAFGGVTIRARRVMHGKTAPVHHTGAGIFRGIHTPVTVARYHSLVTDPQRLPEVLETVAWSEEEGEEGEVQALHHRDLPIWGVQFHPESFFSEAGAALLQNFLAV